LLHTLADNLIVSRLAWLSAAAITLAFMVADYVPGRLSTFYTDVLGPLAASTWLAAAARRWWHSHKESLLRLSTPRLTLLLAVAFLLLLLGGIRLLWVDFWLFAPFLWPLVEIAATLRSRSAQQSAG
jgi:hypothetical protein